MLDRVSSATSPDEVAAGTAHGGDASSLQDTAISHCEKLRRVVELMEWINATRGDPLLASACRRWQEERAQLLAELNL
jgi:hypothetical protein